jgi:hypothetical protein
VDGQDAYGIVVGLRHDGLDDAHPLLSLQFSPLDKLTQRCTARLGKGARLIEDESQPLPALSGPSMSESQLKQSSLPDHRLDNLVQRPPPALVVKLA